MRKDFLQALSIFSLIALSFFVPSVHAAPGDFLFDWGASYHYDDPRGIAVDGAVTSRCD